MRNRIRSTLKRILIRSALPVSRRIELFLGIMRFGRWLKRQGKVPHFDGRFDLYAYLAEGFKNEPIDYIEFGVFRGSSMRKWAELQTHPDTRFYGFDTFAGLPEDWVLLSKIAGKGTFDVHGEFPPIEDARVSFVKGLFQDTLPGFLDTFRSERRIVVHCDADLYTSTLFVLTKLDPLLRPGTYVLFDEFSSIEEFDAFQDYTASFRRELELLGTSDTHFGQAAFVVRR